MKKAIFISSLYILYAFFTSSVSGQSNRYKRNYHQQHFERNKIYDKTYSLWKYNNKWIPKKKDTLEGIYFVDERNYKGLINYGVTFRSKDYRTFYYWESLYMHFLMVEIEKARFNPKDSIIEIEGYVSGGWGDTTKKVQKEDNIENTIDVYLGEKTDTIKHCYYHRFVNEESIEVKLNNRQIDETTILDTFPAFYFKNGSHFITAPKGRRPFKIRGKVSKNTLLAFGDQNCYSEIFDLGSMVYYPNKNKRRKREKKEALAYKALIINNELVSEIEKTELKPKQINYYTYTEKAENCIRRNQFAQAKLIYIQLNKEYPNMYARDITNAVRCSILSRDLKTAFLLGKKLATKGIELTYFNSKIFNNMQKNSEWKSFSISYDSILNHSKSKWNTNLKNQVQQLLEEDQQDYGLANRKSPEVLFQTTERVTDKLVYLLKQQGFPNEEKIGAFTKNDTILIQSPDYNVILRHAVQQKPIGLSKLMELLDKSAEMLEYDKQRSNNHKNFPSACLHIYKGNLYNNKSCGKNEMMIKKIQFEFNNPHGFILDYGDFIVSEYNKENPKEWDDYYSNNFNLIIKLTDDWEFYEK
jgi:hypothetical protein